MPKPRFGLSKGATSERPERQDFYKGPKPPKGNYTLLVKRIVIKQNVNKDNMVVVLFEITEPADSARAKYNGYGIWNNYNLTDQGAPYLAEFCDAVGAPASAFEPPEDVLTDNSNPPNILKIGKVKVVDKLVRAYCGDKTNNKSGELELRVIEFLGADEDAADEQVDAEEAEAAGLDEEATEDVPDDQEQAEEGYSEDELNELTPADLKGICDDWGITYAPKATKATLIKLILTAQEEAGMGEEETAEEEPAEAEEEQYSEEDLEGLDLADLKNIYTDKGWDLPRPPVRGKLVKGILAKQAEPPF